MIIKAPMIIQNVDMTLLIQSLNSVITISIYRIIFIKDFSSFTVESGKQSFSIISFFL